MRVQPCNFRKFEKEIIQVFRSSALPCPEGSFLAPEIGILFGDAVGASLVRGPWLPPRGCYVESCVTLLYVDD